MTAATYRLPVNVEFLVIPPAEELDPTGRDLLDVMQRETPNYSRTPSGETLLSEDTFLKHALSMNWDPESLEYEVKARRERRSVVVPVQFP